MEKLKQRVENTITTINDIHDSLNIVIWKKLNQKGFVFELERSAKKIKNLLLDIEELNRELKLLMEKNTPELDTLIIEINKQLEIIETNLALEKAKKFKEETLDILETQEVPELYDSIQQKIIILMLRARNEIEKVKTFLLVKDEPPIRKGNTAKALVEIIQKQENELRQAKERNLELKRKNFFGSIEEISTADIEKGLHETDKLLTESVTESKKALKNHLAQLNYVEGSFIQLKNEIEKIEDQHSRFTKKSLELIKDLKKERDFARKIALEVEQETIAVKNSYTHQLLDFEKRKSEIEEKIKQKYQKETEKLKNEIEEKRLSSVNLMKIVEEQEKEIKILKQKLEKGK
ncbi:MAG: hypothetical protein GX950_01645 [Candidatus Diapherotrites archaeon]|jgi:hypothetical protein|uniref:Uncharacterized protein n=1 Tax=Candidatus Iainarchaeum sp. TaxID=3101447 RepID=A0A7K4BZ39_9ARCH|nr:hypothetical protein [Candidatus Diapherotrites archaeon]